uniref:Uncharacterized protein n=1 Tax=Rhizophora mucronata TaxID=61149 RepID=A0A2P2KE35_RHIMU
MHQTLRRRRGDSAFEFQIGFASHLLCSYTWTRRQKKNCPSNFCFVPAGLANCRKLC